MGYGDFAPPSGHHPKKPLTKAQVKKLESAYLKAGAISASVKSQEEGDQEGILGETESLLKLL